MLLNLQHCARSSVPHRLPCSLYYLLCAGKVGNPPTELTIFPAKQPLLVSSTTPSTRNTVPATMHFKSASLVPVALAVAAATVSGAHAAPSQQSQYADGLGETSAAAAPLVSWFSSTISQLIPSSSYFSAQSPQYVDYARSSDKLYSSLDKPDYSDYTIWKVIQENEHLSDFKRVLKYSGPGSKELLDDKSKKLTFLAPVNWHHDKHDHEGRDSGLSSVMPQWNAIEHQINMFEEDDEDKHSSARWFKDDEDRKRKRKAIAYLIDATVKYHVIHAHEPLTAWDVAQNSSVATSLSIGSGKARDVLGNLLDGEHFRLRVGKSLLPKPSAYFNFYSRLVFPDVNVGGSIVHAVSFPILIPPSALQTLFFAQPYFGSLTTALQKVWVARYLGYPINATAMHHHDYMSMMHDASAMEPAEQLTHMLGGEDAKEPSKDRQHHYHGNPKGLTGVTLFAPANVAWGRLPPVLRLFLFSPFGKHVLQKVLALHALPWTIFYADFVHEHGKKAALASAAANNGLVAHEEHTDLDAGRLIASGKWPFTGSQAAPLPLGAANVTKYTFTTGCPKLHWNKTTEIYSKYEFETVDVEVYRYYILPGNRGPLQTRVSVQGVPVLIQDIPAGNGALHQIERFIMPKDHPHKGIWAHMADQARLYGFGDVDVTTLDL